MVFGGRGAPYHFGSAIKPGFDRDDRVFAALRATLVDLFPVLVVGADHPRLGRRPRRPARLVRLGGAGPLDRARVGRRLRRRRREHHQPGRPHPARPGPGPRHRPDPAALGRSPLAAAGSPSRCAGSAPTPACGRCGSPTSRRASPAGRASWRARCRRCWVATDVRRPSPGSAPIVAVAGRLPVARSRRAAPPPDVPSSASWWATRSPRAEPLDVALVLDRRAGHDVTVRVDTRSGQALAPDDYRGRPPAGDRAGRRAGRAPRGADDGETGWTRPPRTSTSGSAAHRGRARPAGGDAGHRRRRPAPPRARRGARRSPSRRSVTASASPGCVLSAPSGRRVVVQLVTRNGTATSRPGLRPPPPDGRLRARRHQRAGQRRAAVRRAGRARRDDAPGGDRGPPRDGRRGRHDHDPRRSGRLRRDSSADSCPFSRCASQTIRCETSSWACGRGVAGRPAVFRRPDLRRRGRAPGRAEHDGRRPPLVRRPGRADLAAHPRGPVGRLLRRPGHGCRRRSRPRRALLAGQRRSGSWCGR